MIKVLVVDDEVRQRRSIIRHVQWEKYRMSVIGEAEDAEQALQHGEMPDLLITDIRLLGSSGLELAARMRERNPQLRVIMVTGYEEFEYARTALHIGVDAFLVKPIDFGLLDNALQQIHATLERENQLQVKLQDYRHRDRADYLDRLLHGLLMPDLMAPDQSLESQAAELNLFIGAGPRVVLVVAGPRSGEQQTGKGQGSGAGAGAVADAGPGADAGVGTGALLQQVAERVWGDQLEACIGTARREQVFIVRFSNSEELDSMLERYVASLEQAGAKGAIIGVGSEAAALAELARSYRHAIFAANQRMLNDTGPIFYWDQLHIADALKPELLEEYMQQFVELLASGESDAARSLLGELMGLIVSTINWQGAELRSLCMDLVTKASRVVNEAGEAGKRLGTEQELWMQLLQCDTDQEVIQEAMAILAQCCQYVGERKRSHAGAIVQRAIDYMSANYMNNLSLRSVADAVYLSPNYLGALLRAELGISFTNQLARIRIAEAKELLRSPDLKLYEVAERVGYQNFGHFSNLFRRMTGFTPKDYRQLH